MIDRYDPLGRGLGLRQVMDRLLEDAVLVPRQGAAGGGPSVDVYEDGDQLVVEAQLPGVKPDDINVSVENGVLTISGQTEAEEERKERTYLLREKRSGRFTRSLHLPPTYTPDPSEATFEHGVLRLVFPKAESAKPRRIQIGGSSQQARSSGQEQSQPSGGRATS
jgi:HSP20 family protein